MQINATPAVLDAASGEVHIQPSPASARIDPPGPSAANDPATSTPQPCVEVLALSMECSAAGF
jgi:hypothetical protein